MSLDTVRTGHTRHPLYPLYLGIFGILCIIAGIVFAAEFRPPGLAHAEEEPAALNAQAAVNVPAALGQNPFREVVKQVKPAVVNITTEREVSRTGAMGDLPFRFQFPDSPSSPFGDDGSDLIPTGGSGFFVDPEGHIITNHHVVQDAVRIQVTLDDGRVYEAEIVGSDPSTDVAVIKLKDPKAKLPYLRLGDSEQAEIGDWVIAVGSPLGLEQTVTVGVVSAKNRNQVNVGGSGLKYSDFIQTDAAINYGNSGGPLLTIDGTVVGMNTAIAGGQNVSGIGFAVPANKIRFVYENLITEGVVRRGYIGLLVKEVTPGTAEINNLPAARGAMVTRVEPNTPAERAGVQFGDVVTHVDGIEVRNQQHMVNLIAEKGVGVTVNLKIMRNGKPVDLKIKTEPRPDEPAEPARPAADERPATGAKETITLQDMGLQVSTLDETLSRRFELPAGTTGVSVDAVKKGSLPDREGILVSDIITHVNNTAITSAESFQQALDRAAQGDGYARLTVMRLLRNDWVSLPFVLRVQ